MGAAAGERAPFRVVSYNIAFAIRIEQAIEELRTAPPLRGADALVLQEMDAPGVERIAQALGMDAVYFPSGVHPRHGRDFGCAVLSPWPLEAPRKLILPHGARVSGLRRAAVSALVVRGATRVRVWSVHLPSPRAVSRGSRRDQIRALLEAAAQEPAPTVVAGDFNAYDVGHLFARGGFGWSSRDVGATTRDGKPYDHVFARGFAAQGAAAGVARQRLAASDHDPVWAVLPLP